jgi:uncharacterized ubiquitin-like protein YukD
MSKSYIFKVNDYAEIDLARISRENPEAEALIVTGIKGEVFDARLLLSEKFLSHFDAQSSIKVYSENLRPAWGSSLFIPFMERTPQFHKYCLLKSKHIEEIISDLKQAKTFIECKKQKHTIKMLEKQKHTIKVSELNVDDKAKSSNKEVYQMGGPEVLSDNDESTKFLIHHSIYSDEYTHHWENFRINYMGKRLEISYKDNQKTKSQVDKVIINGEVYVKAIPCTTGTSHRSSDGTDIPF